LQRHSSNNPKVFVKSILDGDIRSAAQLLTLIERRDPAALPLLKALYPHTGKARLIGVTGPAGVGKSTLINRLTEDFRKKNRSVGILAIDPTSPLSGGALLGDRLRMHQHFLDQGVFIRSLATQGAWGGISPALFDAIHILDAMGKAFIFIETIGVGQDEVRIAQLAQTVLLVLAPGMGDTVQIMKAGLLEIGDLIAVNKGTPLEGRQLAQQLQAFDQNHPIVRISAEEGEGLRELSSQLERELQKIDTFSCKKEFFAREELQWLLYEKLQTKGMGFPFTSELIESVARREKDPYEIVETWGR